MAPATKKVVSDFFERVSGPCGGACASLAGVRLRLAEEEPGEHQQPSGAGDEVRQVHAWLQDLPQDSALGQG